MGRRYRIYLAGESVFICRQCGTHLAVSESVVSRQFHGQHGRAMLVHHAVNVYDGDAVEREMRTGKHTVRDIFCAGCKSVLGWKYDFAFEPDQKYKEGRYILERELVTEIHENKHHHERVRIEEVPLTRDLVIRA